MSDDKNKTGSPDSKRINIHEPYEVEYWHKKLGITPQQLRDAVKNAGSDSVEKVKKQLGQ